MAGGHASLPTSLQIPTASTDTLLTGMNWLGLAETTQRGGTAQQLGEWHGGRAEFSAADTLYSFFNPCF